ncbi:MAG: AIR synthase-related protein, partial [Thermoplasmata archaeon]|nr:AIR synthase-related protein [Thermoplasmata archaeon]
DFKTAGDALYLVGRTQAELGGSLYARRRGLRGVAVPRPDPASLRRRGERLLRSGGRGELRAVHDVSDGGLAVSLAEMAFGGRLGFDVDLAHVGLSSAAHGLVAEGGSRWLVEVSPERAPSFERRLRGEPWVRLGSVTERNGVLRQDAELLASLDLEALYPKWRTGLASAAPAA